MESWRKILIDQLVTSANDIAASAEDIINGFSCHYDNVDVMISLNESAAPVISVKTEFGASFRIV